MKLWHERAWRSEKGAEIVVEAGSAEECRRLFRERVKHPREWTEIERKEEEA